MKKASGLAAYYIAALKGLEQEKSRIDEEIRQVRSLLARHTGAGAAVETPAAVKEKKPRKKRELSATARARIAAAQKKRWAEFRKKPKGS